MTELPRITPKQMLAARALLRLSRDRLAAQSETTAALILLYENEGRVMKLNNREPSFDAYAAIRTAFEQAGVTFTNGDEPGVKLKRQPQ